MRDPETKLPVARLEPRDAADRMVLVRAVAARWAGEIGRVGLAVGKVAGFMGLLGILAVLGSSTGSHRVDVKVEPIELPKFDFQYRVDHVLLMNELAKPAFERPMLEDLNLRDPFERPMQLEKRTEAKAPRAKRQPRP